MNRYRYPMSYDLYLRIVASTNGAGGLGSAINNYCYIMQPRMCRPAPEDHHENLVRLVWLAELSDFLLLDVQSEIRNTTNK